MTYCPLELNESGFFECPKCSWTSKRKAAKPPCRNCRKAPALNSPEHRAKIKAKILAELEPMARTAALSAIDEQLDKCVTCERFDGRSCTARGSACKTRVRWLEFLALMTEPCGLFSLPPEHAQASSDGI